MSEDKDSSVETRKETETSTVAVDLWKLSSSVTGKPGTLGEQPPETWREVWRQFNRHVKRIVAGLPRYLAEKLEGQTRMIRGATAPVKTTDRIESAHVQAEMLEEQRQRQLASTPASILGVPDEAVGNVEDVLNRFRRQGFTAELARHPKGYLVVVIVRPDLQEVAGEALTAEVVAVSSPEKKKITTRRASGVANSSKGSDVYRESLTVRQREVLALAADDLTYRDMAEHLSVSVHTVKAHMHSIFKKLDVPNRKEAVRRANALDILSARSEIPDG